MGARLAVTLAIAVVVLGAAASTAPANVPGAPYVLVIGDSVATGMLWDRDAIATLQNGLNVDWQVGVCRRITGTSCPFQGKTVPNMVDVVSTLPRAYPVVVVEMGYNDFESTFATSVDDAIEELLSHGAQHILWLTLRVVHHPYIHMNAILAQAAKRYPQVELIDWNRYSRSHPDWFQSDGEHLTGAGGVAMASFIHLHVDEVVNPLEIESSPARAARLGHRYAGRVVADGGSPPYRFELLDAPPRGLHLLANGRFYGTPRRPGRFVVKLRVSDAEGQTAMQRIVFTVKR